MKYYKYIQRIKEPWLNKYKENCENCILLSKLYLHSPGKCFEKENRNSIIIYISFYDNNFEYSIKILYNTKIKGFDNDSYWKGLRFDFKKKLDLYISQVQQHWVA